MAPKKSKNSSGNKKKAAPSKGRRNSNKQTPKTEFDDKLVQQSQLNPQERVAFVRPLWEKLSHADRVELLTVHVDDVFERLRRHSDTTKRGIPGPFYSLLEASTEEGGEVSLEDVYERGLERLNAQGTWKVWQWTAEEAAFVCAETFKKEVLEKKLPEELQKLLPREEGKPTEKPAEAALRERMTALINNIHTQLQSAQDAWRRGQRAVTEAGEQTRDANIDLVISILDTLQHEHHCLYHTILTPVAELICSLVPAKLRKSTRTELFFEDFEKITPEEVAKLYEWLTEKVDALCSKLKPDPKDEDVDEDEEAVGDIDLFSLTEDKTAFTVNAKWLEHLQDRKLSEEGQPRKIKKGEDEYKVGLVLEWVYGSIVSTAEKARDGAKRPLGNWLPSVRQAYQNLVTMLKDQLDWDTRCRNSKALLKDILSIRKRIQALGKQHGCFIPGTAAARKAAATCADLPDAVIEGVLCRESLLTQAKLHILKYERMMASSQLKTLRTELMQNEPEFERLKRELENAKTLVRSSERDRAHAGKANDSILEDQLEAQSAFREQGARLQGMYDKRQRTELEMTRREQEISQLENWHKNVTQLLGKLQKYSGEQSADDAMIAKVRAAFHKDFKKQLYSDVDDQTFFNRIKTELKAVEKRVEDGAVVLQHLEMFLINVACDDPGAVIGTSVILPLLQERLDKKAMEFSMQKASEAMDALLKMEEEKKELQAKKELRRKVKSATQMELMTVVSKEEDSTDEKVENVPAQVEAPVAVGAVCLGSHSVEDPVLVERSIRYEASLLAEAEAEEFQSVSNRRRGDRKKAQQNKRIPHGMGPKRHSAPVQKGAETEGQIRRSASGPPLHGGSKHQGAKLFVNRNKNPRPGRVLSKAASTEAKRGSEQEDASVEDVQVTEQKLQKGGNAWVKGAIPASVTTGHAQTNIPSARSASSKQSSTASESSVNSPSTPDASDVDRALPTAKSDAGAKETSTLHLEEIKTALPENVEIEHLHAKGFERSEAVGERFRGDGNQFFSIVQAMGTQPERADDVHSLDGSHRSDRSSDAPTPEPEHVMMGPPLMPPPMGMPPPIGPMPPFHPNYYGPPIRPVVGPDGVRFPGPFPPPLSAPVTSAPPLSEPGSPSASGPPPHPYPYYTAPLMPPTGMHMPMPPYLPIMPYGQWFPPGVPPMSYESQVKKFPLRPTAEEFVPPSMKKDETEEKDTTPLEEGQHRQTEETCNYSTVDMSDVTDSAVAVTQTIEQAC